MSYYKQFKKICYNKCTCKKPDKCILITCYSDYLEKELDSKDRLIDSLGLLIQEYAKERLK